MRRLLKAAVAVLTLPAQVAVQQMAFASPPPTIAYVHVNAPNFGFFGGDWVTQTLCGSSTLWGEDRLPYAVAAFGTTAIAATVEDADVSVVISSNSQSTCAPIDSGSVKVTISAPGPWSGQLYNQVPQAQGITSTFGCNYVTGTPLTGSYIRVGVNLTLTVAGSCARTDGYSFPVELAGNIVVPGAVEGTSLLGWGYPDMGPLDLQNIPLPS